MSGAFPLALNFEAIDRYASRLEIYDYDEFDEFLRLMLALDNKFLEHAKKRSSPETQSETKA